MFANGGWVILRRAMSTEQREKVIVFIVVVSGVKHATNALSSTEVVPKKYQSGTPLDQCANRSPLHIMAVVLFWVGRRYCLLYVCVHNLKFNINKVTGTGVPRTTRNRT